MGKVNQYFHKTMEIKKDHVYYLTEFEYLKRNPKEIVIDFVKRFNKLYNKIPTDCKPLVTIVKVRFSKAFDDDFYLMLRERKYMTLADMQTDAIEDESNREASSKLRAKAEKEERKLKART